MGKKQKLKESSHKRAMMLALSEQVTTMLQGADTTV